MSKFSLLFLLIFFSMFSKANSLRDRKGFVAQDELSKFDSERKYYFYDRGSTFTQLGGMTEIYINNMRQVQEDWKRAEPKNYESIMRTYFPICFAGTASPALPLQSVDPRLNQRRDAAAQVIEASFQKYETLETPDYYQKLHVVEVLKSNLDVFNTSISMLPFVFNKVSELLNQVKSLESSHQLFLNNLSTLLSQPKDANETLKTLNDLNARTTDSAEKELINNAIDALITFQKSTSNANENFKRDLFMTTNNSATLEAQMNTFKDKVTAWETDLRQKYSETKSTFDSVNASIIATQAEMKRAEDNVDVNIQAISNLRNEVYTLAQNNFTIVDRRVRELVDEWKRSNFNNNSFMDFKHANEQYFNHVYLSMIRKELALVECIN